MTSMNPSVRALTFALLVALVPALGQTQTTRRVVVAAGNVTGSDLAIEGPLSVRRGSTLRWGVQAFDVVGLRDIRPSGRAELRAFTSFARDRASAELVLDDDGRGLLEVRVPEDAPAGFHVVLELRTRARIVRRFELDVAVTGSRSLDVSVFPESVFPGSPVHVLGRLAISPEQTAIANEALELELSDGAGPIGRPVRVTTDANGVLTHTFQIPRDVRVGPVRIVARTLTTERPISDTAGVSVVARTAPPLLVAVRPSDVVAASAARVNVEVVVRRPDGRPLPRATVTLVDGRREHRDQRAVTDARGHATLYYILPRVDAGHRDQPIDVRVERVGVGSANARALVRVARAGFAARISVEGGRLVPELDGRVYVRAVSIDGRPAVAGTPVRLSGPRVPEGLEARTDAAGVATFDFRLAAPAADGEDACGGEAATSLQATVGAGPRIGVTNRCASVDADGLVRVRVGSPRTIAGNAVHVTVARASRIARTPVVIEMLATDAGRAVVGTRTLAGDVSEADLALPADVRGLVIVRARVLYGAERMALRGGSTGFIASAEVPFGMTSRFDGEVSSAQVTLDGPSSDAATVVSVVMPIDEARSRYGVYDVGQRITVPRPQPVITSMRDASLLAATVADHVPADITAAAALVAGVVTPLPSPAEDTTSGVLRDPYRARARFVEGRLALVYRAIEQAIETSVPAQMDDVAFVSNGRFTFNASILEVAAEVGELGGEGATGLSGEPITVAQLSALDPAFTYDNVARRITRKRLFMLLLELRSFVRENQLDVAWARLGEPRQWLPRILEESGSYASIEPRHLVDAWGRPFVLVPTSRTRFDRVVPVAGYELVSGGPDGRVGTGDDIWDPTARVLPAGGVYAQAVGEDALVARLGGVELGRMTVTQGVSLFPVDSAEVPEIGDSVAPPDVYGDAALPDLIEEEPDALSLRRITQTIPSALVRLDGTTAARAATVPLDTEPRTWGVLSFAMSREGSVATTFATARTGSPILVNGEMPERVHVGESIITDVPLTNVTDTDRDVRLAITAEGIQAEAQPSVRIPSGQTVIVPLTLGSTTPGRGRLSLRLTDANGVALGAITRRIVSGRGEHPERRRVSALVGARDVDVTLAAPDGARDVSARLVLVAPSHLADLPDLAQTLSDAPAIIAWSRVMAGREVEPALRAALLRDVGEGSLSLIERAAAIVALASLDDDASRVARQGLEGGLSVGPDLGAALVALASAGVPDEPAEAHDAVGRFLASALVPLRRTLRDAPDDTLALARASAALLVASPEDAHGLAMLSRIETRVEGIGNGALVTATDADRLDVVAATFALALASHQAGKLEQRDRLLRGAMSELPVVGRAGGEAAFWYLAAGAYGLLPSATPRATVRIGASTTEVTFEEGRVVLPITLAGGDDVRVRVRTPGGESIVAEIEGAYVVPFSPVDGPLFVEIRGDIGRVGRVAALELCVRATIAVSRPVVEISLPAGVVADESLIASIERVGRVVSAEARRPGFLRITLGPLGVGEELRIPLPLVHRARGLMTGLAISAYPASTPYLRTIVAPISVEVPGEEE